MTSSPKPRQFDSSKTTYDFWTVLLFVPLIWGFSMDTAIAQQPTARYVSESDFEKKAEADKNAKLVAKLDALRGKTFWYQPKPLATSRIEFHEPSKDGGVPLNRGGNKFVVEIETSFTVTGYDKNNYDSYYLKIEFPDGKIGYLKVAFSSTMYPDEHPLINNLYPGKENAFDFQEYLFSRPPQEIFATEKKATAERKVKQAKADEKWKTRGGVTLSMTSAQVLGSNWGKPNKVNRTITQNGTREQWVYGGNNYLYFENGKLTAIQN